jgi:sigma-B regulation protein RsbU (phosphoserine phosphatase)
VAVHHSAGFWPGGDYYDVVSLPDGRLLFLIADASDQGAASTALAIMVRVVLHSCPLGSAVTRVPFCPFSAPSTQPPHILLGHLNHVLAENALEEQSMTAFCGVLNPEDGSFIYANAGHPYPRWWRASHGNVEAVREASGLPLGTDGEATYQPQAITLETGDLLALYTDSLTAGLHEGRGISVWELLDCPLREAAPRGAEAVKSAVLARLDDFLAGKAYPDEITFLIVGRQKVAGSSASGYCT